MDTFKNVYVMCEKCLSKSKGRLFVAFIDFSRAFDTIPHLLLLTQLVKRGIHGKVLGLLRSMYNSLKASVRTSHDLSDWLECTLGARQGCMLSPFLFSIAMAVLMEDVNTMMEYRHENAHMHNQNADDILLL